jgi:2-oxo-4-hydroxy-4-carboxy-5-ureidoimidazoline decarboxylase
MSTISLDELNAADERGFINALSNIYEHAPWVAESAASKRPFPTLAALADAMQQAVTQASGKRQHALIAGHPDLANKAVRLDTLTLDSQAEQTSAGLDRLNSEEFDRFHRLNTAYREKFSIPFIICVRRHTKDSILREFERRLRNDAGQEQQTALSEISRIAALRLDQHVRGPDRLKVHGRLSTHVLDTYHGHPAAGVTVEFFEIGTSGGSRLLSRAITNGDGRTDRPLMAEQPIPISQYELRFAIGDYFVRQGVPLPDPPFLGTVPIRFAVAEPEAHYHVPLLATPWSYSTYRGS